MTLVTVMVVVLRRGGKRGGQERRRLEVRIYKCVIDKVVPCTECKVAIQHI